MRRHFQAGGVACQFIFSDSDRIGDQVSAARPRWHDAEGWASGFVVAQMVDLSVFGCDPSAARIERADDWHAEDAARAVKVTPLADGVER